MKATNDFLRLCFDISILDWVLYSVRLKVSRVPFFDNILDNFRFTTIFFFNNCNSPLWSSHSNQSLRLLDVQIKWFDNRACIYVSWKGKKLNVLGSTRENFRLYCYYISNWSWCRSLVWNLVVDVGEWCAEGWFIRLYLQFICLVFCCLSVGTLQSHKLHILPLQFTRKMGVYIWLVGVIVVDIVVWRTLIGFWLLTYLNRGCVRMTNYALL